MHYCQPDHGVLVMWCCLAFGIGAVVGTKIRP